MPVSWAVCTVDQMSLILGRFFTVSGTDITAGKSSRVITSTHHVNNSQQCRKVGNFSRRQNQPVAYSVENGEVEQERDDTSFYDSSGRDNNAITPPEAKSDVF